MPHHFDLITRAFAKLGVIVEHEGDTAIVRKNQNLTIEEPFTSNLLPKIEAAPWPYFSVDLLPLMIALSTRAKGTIHFWNKVYENGFSWMPELAKFGGHLLPTLGANEGRRSGVVKGKSNLKICEYGFT